jgi:hypothetical protein
MRLLNKYFVTEYVNFPLFNGLFLDSKWSFYVAGNYDISLQHLSKRRLFLNYMNIAFDLDNFITCG